MIILLTGITGFIGSHLAPVLRAAGHRVIGTRRDASVLGTSRAEANVLYADFNRDVEVASWVPRLHGVDVVINAVGILRETRTQKFSTIHTATPQALFRACAIARVGRVIQVSALGADHGTGRYFASKRAADELLASLPLAWSIVQPSLVYAPGGTSANLFSMLATLPVIALPGRGEQRVQPIHVDDLTAAIAELCVQSTPLRCRVPLVGPEPVAMRDMLQQLRSALGLGRAPSVSVPTWVMRPAARILGLSSRSLLSAETLAMLNAENVASPQLTTTLLQRPPRPIAEFVEPAARAANAAAARLSWLLPMLRCSIALVWIWTGVVSLGVYPRELSFELLGRSGVPPALQPLMLYGAALLDLGFGAATLVLRRRRGLWLAQIALIVLYSVIISIQLPEFWLHPYGPMSKNLPMLAAIYCLYVLERPIKWNT
jgi:uncharacterized protein YbjT (DUF2867 family)